MSAARPPAKGWCPGAHRPMASGDGLIVRIRPLLGRITAAAARGIARAALTHGSGEMDLTSRANLQLRGVRLEAHEPLIADLSALAERLSEAARLDEDALPPPSRQTTSPSAGTSALKPSPACAAKDSSPGACARPRARSPSASAPRTPKPLKPPAPSTGAHRTAPND